MAAPDHALRSLVRLARDRSAPIADRHEAFGQLVRRFRGFALACAHARLRDRTLAEDAAQDAFLVAWERLDQLREPDAFPGWIRRLVLTQCHRRLRCPQLPLVPQDKARSIGVEDPALDVDAPHDSAIVHRALARLAPSDRLVLSLFYGAERSHKEIAVWLGVPVTTVARRLAHAKRRLQKHALDAWSGALRAQHRTAENVFMVELSARLRRAGVDDAASVMYLASRMDVRRRDPITTPAAASAYIIEDPVSRTPIAYAAATQTIFKPIYELQLALGDDAIRCHAGDVLLMQIVEEVTAKGAITLRYRSSSERRGPVGFLTSRGFEISQRTEDWRLDTSSATRRPTATSTDLECGFAPLEAVARDPALFEQALNLITSALADDPDVRPFLPVHPDTLRRGLRMQRDGILALDGRTLQGIVGASADDVVADGCRINVLVVGKPWRRRGLARALLDRLLAHRLGTTARFVAPPRADLTGWLSRCGFTHATDVLLLERLLRKTVPVAPERLDEYVGHYVVEGTSMPPITIERHGASLVSKAGDMRDVLLAASESEFFTRHHYGEGRFERDSLGRVTRLVFTEEGRSFIAVRSSRL